MFQSPRGDFGFLKNGQGRPGGGRPGKSVSIPSRGFWFFEVADPNFEELVVAIQKFQSPRGDFGFLKRQLNHVFSVADKD